MSYNILKKNVRFSGGDNGTIEGIVDISGSQQIVGDKTFTSTITSSADVIVSGSGKISASFFYGDGSTLSGIPSGIGGSNTQVQFNDNGVYGGSADFTFATGSSTLSVNTGSVEVLSASNYISASTYYGDGSNLTNLGEASSVAASNIVGSVVATQISHSSPLGVSGGNLTVNLNANRGIVDDSGLALDVGNLSSFSSTYDDSYNMIISGSGAIGNKRVSLSWLEGNIELGANRITSGTINNARLPSVISVSEVTASSGFSGDGSNLSNIAAGSTNQIQFHGFTAGDLAASSDLTFNDTTDTLTTKTGSFEAVSASTAQFGEITSNLIPETTNTYYLGSPDLSKRWVSVNSVNSNVSGLAVSVTGAIQHALGIGTLNPSYELDVTGTIAVNGQISASSYVSASSYAIAGGTIVDENANTNFGQLTFFVTSSADTVTPADNEKATFYVDEAANKFFVRVKYSDGTVKSGSIDLL